MSKGKKFVIGCCITIGVGMMFCLTGFAMGTRVTGVSLGANGISVYTPQGKVGEEQEGCQTGEEALEKFDSINMEVDYADVLVQPGEDYGISYNVDSRCLFSYEINDGTLVIKESAGKAGFHVGLFNFGYVENETGKGMIIVRLPKGSELSEVTIDSDYGDVICGDFSAEKLGIDADYGNVELGRVENKNASVSLDYGELDISSFSGGDLAVQNDYGDITLEDITAGNLNLGLDSGNLGTVSVTADNLAVENEYGDIALEEVTAEEIKLNADSGRISLSEVTADCLAVLSEYGDVKGKGLQVGSFTGEISSGDCDVKELEVKNVKLVSEYGDVTLKLQKPLTDYSYQLQTDYGKVLLGGRDMGENYQSLEQNDNRVDIFCESGDVEVQGAE